MVNRKPLLTKLTVAYYIYTACKYKPPSKAEFKTAVYFASAFRFKNALKQTEIYLIRNCF